MARALTARGRHRATPPAPRDDATRARILTAAAHEFAARGFAGARVQAIARAARVNVALLYYYFGNKQGVYAGVLDWLVSPIAGIVSEELRAPVPPEEALAGALAAHARLIGEHPELRQILLREMLESSGDRLAPVLARLAQGPLARLVRLIADGQRQGRFRSDLDPRLTAITLVAPNVYFHLAAPLVAHVLERAHGPPTAAEREAFVANSVRFALAALAPAAG
jgi:TetR/AcrR family transcriptional regulator